MLIAGEKNVIYDRLYKDFQNGEIFKELPFIPPEWKEAFGLTVILKEDPVHVIPESVLFLTNIQQLEAKKRKKEEVEEYVYTVCELPPVYSVQDIYQKKPVLFVQCPENTESDEIFGYLNSISDLKDKVLLMHTDSTGEIRKAELPIARKAAKFIDVPDMFQSDGELSNYYPSGVDAIVSTMMLNEGWDVRNVNVIVGLRAYTSKRKVLPEQVIGRGLRKMFPEEDAKPEKSVNILEVIGPPGLIDILEELENQEGITFGEFDTGKSLNLTTIFVDENKRDKDIEIPILSPRIIIREFYLDEVEIDNLPSLNIPLENWILEMEYVAVDMLKGMEMIMRSWDLPVPRDSKSVIAYYTDQILKQLKIGGAFASFY